MSLAKLEEGGGAKRAEEYNLALGNCFWTQCPRYSKSCFWDHLRELLRISRRIKKRNGREGVGMGAQVHKNQGFSLVTRALRTPLEALVSLLKPSRQIVGIVLVTPVPNTPPQSMLCKWEVYFIQMGGVRQTQIGCIWRFSQGIYFGREICREFGGNFAGFLRTHQIKAQRFGQNFGAFFVRNFVA